MHGLFIKMILAATAACSEQSETAVRSGHQRVEADMTSEKVGSAQPARQLPDSFGRNFTTLDEYLEHLRRYAAPIDKPWYREVRPGVYERVTTRVPRRAAETYTRAQLMARFGFTR